jgi:hypothetical protein
MNLIFKLSLVGLLSVPVFAGQSEGHSAKWKSLKSWFTHWKQALERSAVEGHYRRGQATAVAAVRGTGQAQQDPGQPYWKGSLSDKKAAQQAKEREELAATVKLILDGNLEEGEKKLDQFESAHPKSRLLADVREAREKLSELKALSSGTAQVRPTPAQEPEPKSFARPRD